MKMEDKVEQSYYYLESVHFSSNYFSALVTADPEKAVCEFLEDIHVFVTFYFVFCFFLFDILSKALFSNVL